MKKTLAMLGVAMFSLTVMAGPAGAAPNDTPPAVCAPYIDAERQRASDLQEQVFERDNTIYALRADVRARKSVIHDLRWLVREQRREIRRLRAEARLLRAQ